MEMEMSRERLKNLKEALIAVIFDSMMGEMIKLKVRADKITNSLIGKDISDKETQKALYEAVKVNEMFVNLMEDLKIAIEAKALRKEGSKDKIASEVANRVVKLKGVNDRLYLILPVKQLFEFDFRDRDNKKLLTIEGVTQGNPFFLSYLHCREGDKVPCVLNGKVIMKTVEFRV